MVSSDEDGLEAMPRLTVSISDEIDEWIESRAAEFEVSKSKVIRECIYNAKGETSIFTTSVNSDDMDAQAQITNLESRVSKLEEIIQGDTESNSSARTDEQSSATIQSEVNTISAGVNPDEPQGTGQKDVPSDASSDEEEEAEASVQLSSVDSESVKAHLDSTIDNEQEINSILTCWKRLQNRGTLHIKSLKEFCGSPPPEYEDIDAWWNESVQPTLINLPGVEAPEGSGNFYRFKY